MKIVTIGSHRPAQAYYCFDQFFASCERFGHKPLVLSEGYGGLGTKPIMLRNAIENNEIPDEEMIFTDCFDVVFQDQPMLAVRHIGPARKIVFNAEKQCFPEPKLADHHPVSKTPFRYLNSGFAVGYTQAFLDAIKEMAGWADMRPDRFLPNGTWDNPNDQVMWQKQYLFGNAQISLDTQCEVCQTLHGVTEDELDFSESKIRNVLTNTYPIALHINGAKEIWKDKIVSHLHLN